MTENVGQILPSLAFPLCQLKTTNYQGDSSHSLKGLSHEIFTGYFWLEWIYLGLNGNRFWFLSFKEIPSILDS
jgi:hypothetical protein